MTPLPSSFLPGRNVGSTLRRAFGDRRAMSLVELLVVMAIIGMLLALGVSGFQRATQGSSLDNALGGLAAGMELARQTALSQSTYTWVALADGTNSTGANEVSMAVLSSKSGDLARRGPDDVQLISRVERFPGVKLGDAGMLDAGVKLPDTASAGAPFDPDISGGAPISLDGLPNPPTGSVRDFKRLVMFTPQGSAAIDNGEELSSRVPVYESLQVVVVPSKGPEASDTEKKSASVVYLNGVTGLPTVYRPSL